MSHGLFEEKVKLTEEHRYFDGDGKEYLGFSKLYDLICKPFDKESISGFVAKAQGKTKEDVLAEWDGKRDNGSRIDDAITLYNQTNLIADENNDVKDLILSVLAEYKRYKKNISQLIVYNENYKCAGMSDNAFLFSFMKDSAFGMSDIKCFDDVLNTDGTIKHFSYDTLFVRRGWLNAPFNHLPATKYTKICFQLSYYAHLLEELTGRKCNELFIHLIHPVKHTHQKIYLPYLKNDVKLLLETYKPQIDLLLAKKTVVEETNEAF